MDEVNQKVCHRTPIVSASQTGLQQIQKHALSATQTRLWLQVAKVQGAAEVA